MKNKRFVVGRIHAARVAGVEDWRISKTIQNPPKILSRPFYKVYELKRLFPMTFNSDHAHLTYSRFSEFLRDHLLSLFRSSKFAMKKGFTRAFLMRKSRYSEKQINSMLSLYPDCFYEEKYRLRIQPNAPYPQTKISHPGRYAQNAPARDPEPKAVQPPKQLNLGVTYTPIDAQPADPWGIFLNYVRRKRPYISNWFDLVEFKRTSLATAQLIIDERNSIAVEFLQQKELIPWIESTFANMGAPISMEIVVKRVRQKPESKPEPEAATASVAQKAQEPVVAPETVKPTPTVPENTKPASTGRLASLWASIRRRISEIIFP